MQTATCSLIEDFRRQNEKVGTKQNTDKINILLPDGLYSKPPRI